MLVGLVREARAWRATQRSHGVRLATGDRLRALLGDAAREVVGDRAADPAEAGGLVEAAIDHGPSPAIPDPAPPDAASLPSQPTGAPLPDLALHSQAWAATTWYERVPAPDGPLVSVILPTRDRCDLVGQAIASVLASSYARFELLVVDDGSIDETPRVLADIVDPRVSTLRTAGVGAAAARNVALDAATGEVVTYLDDDNLMHSAWLAAVATAFQADAGLEVAYGARVYERGERLAGTRVAAPALQLDLFDRERLERENFIDLNALAHRAGLAQARFDESLTTCHDWDMILRLAAEHEFRVVPVVASLYRTGAPDRLQDRPSIVADVATVRASARQRRPLRVLAYNSLFPLLTEPYIQIELDSLAVRGWDVSFARSSVGPAPMRMEHKVWTGLDEAVAATRPDLVLVHWIEFASAQIDRLASLGLPVAVRAHSFDWETSQARALLDHPACVGIWAYPHMAATVDGVRALPAQLRSLPTSPLPSGDRDLVVSASAGLAKKDFPTLIGAFDRSAAATGLDHRLVVGITGDNEHIATELATSVRQMAEPALLQLNLDGAQIHDLMRRAVAVVYTLRPDVAVFGEPMSILEGMSHGACIIAPDRPEAHRLVGPALRPYRTADDIVSHLTEVAAGGRAIDDERAALRRRAEQCFADPEIHARFSEELADALVAWRRRQPRPS